MCVLQAGEVEKHEQLIQTIVTQTEQSLKLQNETNILVCQQSSCVFF